MSVYTHQNLVKVYAELKNHVGKYNHYTWYGSSMPQITDNVEETIYQAILDSTYKYFLKRKPKSWKSLAMQVSMCLSTQKMDDLKQVSIETRGRNRLAAYCAGFLTMEDIYHLEKESV